MSHFQRKGLFREEEALRAQEERITTDSVIASPLLIRLCPYSSPSSIVLSLGRECINSCDRYSARREPASSYLLSPSTRDVFSARLRFALRHHASTPATKPPSAPLPSTSPPTTLFWDDRPQGNEKTPHHPAHQCIPAPSSRFAPRRSLGPLPWPCPGADPDAGRSPSVFRPWQRCSRRACLSACFSCEPLSTRCGRA